MMVPGALSGFWTDHASQQHEIAELPPVSSADDLVDVFEQPPQVAPSLRRLHRLGGETAPEVIFPRLSAARIENDLEL